MILTKQALVTAVAAAIAFTCHPSMALAQDWRDVEIPVQLPPNLKWQLEEATSDDFNYRFPATDKAAIFGGKWQNHYMGFWEGAGTTKWRHENVSVSDGELLIQATRKPGETKKFSLDAANDGPPQAFDLPATRLGCVTSIAEVKYPAYIEARVKIPNAVVAASVWLLSEDSTQEIDIIESYGGTGDDNRNEWLARRIHLSHHVFIRRPFQDYQPMDDATWHQRPAGEAGDESPYWTDRYCRVGVYWRDPAHLEYYVDGKLAKTTSGFDGSDTRDGVDPHGYTKDATGRRTGLSKPMKVIINMETQTWNAAAGRTPTDEELARHDDHVFRVDWIRSYRPLEVQ